MDEKNKTVKNLKEFFSRLKKDKKAFAAVIIGVVGMLLIMFSELTESHSINSEQQQSSDIVSDYDTAKELKSFIESINGAGKTSVMITYESSYQTVFAKNSEESTSENKSEYKNEYIIIDSQKGETGLTEYTVYPEIRGVAIVCQGADDPAVVQRIVSAVSALFSLSSNKISVTTMTQ